MDAGTRGDEQVLARAVKQLQWKHHRALDGRLRELGSTIVQWDVLRALEANPEASAHELALATFQSDQSLGVMMRRMIANGLITRAVPRGRRYEHRLTDQGRELLETGHGFADAVFDASFGGLTGEERATLLTLLRAAIDAPAGRSASAAT